MFGRNMMVEQDLERIRRANMPPEQLAALEAREAAERAEFEKDRPGVKDILAMIVAVFSLIGPYVLVFVGLLLAFGWLFGMWAPADAIQFLFDVQ